jgi:hypothetical protein
VDVPTNLEVDANDVVAEALTNVAKHDKRPSWKCVWTRRDRASDTVSGQWSWRSRGCEGFGAGLIDHVEAHGGTMAISSPIGSGTA